MPAPKYSQKEIQERVKLMSGKNLTFSNQYGMLFILSDNNEIFLNVTRLVTDESFVNK